MTSIIIEKEHNEHNAHNEHITFGEGLLAERKARRWTRTKLIDEFTHIYGLGLSTSSLHRWEHHGDVPRPSLQQKLYDLFLKTPETWGVIETRDTRWNVPFARNLHFTGREDVFQNIQEHLSKKRPTAICGLGGMGKTQTAIEFAYRYQAAYTYILWIRSETHETLSSDIVTLVKMLGLPEKNERDQKQMQRAFKLWLQTHTSWLLILDNADTLDLVSDLLTVGEGGAILLTTRKQCMGRHIKKVPLEKLNELESVSYLLQRADYGEKPEQSIPQQEREAAMQIYTLVDGLPLALDQAASYIEESGCSIAQYLSLYSAHPGDFLKRISSVDHEEYPYSVSTTWTLSFRAIEKSSPVAADILAFCAFPHPDAIQLAFFTKGASYLSKSLQQIALDPLALNEAVSVLLNYSLLRRSAETDTLTIHRLVQSVLKQEMKPEIRALWATRTIRVVEAIFPDGEFASWGSCEEYLPHVHVCTGLIEEHKLTLPEAVDLLQRAGAYLTKRSRLVEAEAFLKQALKISELLFGLDHSTTAKVMDTLGMALNETSRLDEAKRLFSQALKIRKHIFGEDSLEFAETLHHIALIDHTVGLYDKAEPYYLQAIETYERFENSSKSELSFILVNLGEMYIDQGNLEKGEQLIIRALDIREQVLGSEHPDTAECLNDLAMIYKVRGQHDEAEKLLLQALHIYETHLGPKHRLTAATLHNLAGIHRVRGQFSEAEQLWWQVLSIREQTLGEDHIDLVNVFYHLITLYSEQERYEEIKPLLKRALSTYKRHPAGKPPRVIRMVQELTTLSEKLTL